MKIIIPTHENHNGDTFRELVIMWKEKGLCDIEYKNIRNVWLNNYEDILLYDRPTLEHFGRQKFNFALFGNTVPSIPNSSSWIFWARRPRLLENIKKQRKGWNHRNIESIFLGKVENPLQYKKRTPLNWSEAIEKFEMPVSQGYPIADYKYTQQQYLELLTKSKYGLCLPGYGPKCNREIELMGLGVIPILTPGIDITYYNPLEENTHYIRIEGPADIKNKIQNINQEKWEFMSNECIKWYEKNCSVQGSFNTTCEILEKNNIKI